MRLRLIRAPAPLIAMKARRREYLAPSVRLKPSMREAVIVMPERLVPGIRASIWARPMNTASFNVKLSSVRVLSNFLSAHHRMIPNIKVAHAMTYIVLSQSGSRAWRTKPAAMTGIELMIIKVRSLALLVVLLPVLISFKPMTIARASRQK